MKNNIVFLTFVIVSSLIFTACLPQTPAVKTEETGVTAKKGDTIKTGTIEQKGTDFYLTAVDGSSEMIESYNVELSEYLGQTVTITAQYSGDTLFVSKVE